MGEDFEKTSKGFVDFLLLDSKGFPLIVLEAKSEDKEPLVGKEQARKYARSQSCRFVILSNGNFALFLGFGARQSLQLLPLFLHRSRLAATRRLFLTPKG